MLYKFEEGISSAGELADDVRAYNALSEVPSQES
jgi:hypothetical protein